MTDEERAGLEARCAELRRKLEKRRDMPGFAANVAALEAAVAEAEALLNDG